MECMFVTRGSSIRYQETEESTAEGGPTRLLGEYVAVVVKTLSL